jgi:hypothetical protein
MNSLEEYLKQTESAVVHIFDRIDSYLKVVKNSPPSGASQFCDE